MAKLKKKIVTYALLTTKFTHGGVVKAVDGTIGVVLEVPFQLWQDKLCFGCAVPGLHLFSGFWNGSDALSPESYGKFQELREQDILFR